MFISNEYPEQKNYLLFKQSIEDSSQIPEYCERLSVLLSAQPIFRADKTLNGELISRVMTIKNLGDAEACALFNLYAKHLFPKKNLWTITLYRSALTLWYEKGSVMCPAEKLLKLYKRALDELRRGWERAKPEAEYEVFKKKSLSIEEPELICTLANKFGLGKSVQCQLESEDSHGEDGSPRKTYPSFMVIKKTDLQNVAEKFGFELPKERSLRSPNFAERRKSWGAFNTNKSPPSPRVDPKRKSWGPFNSSKSPLSSSGDIKRKSWSKK